MLNHHAVGLWADESSSKNVDAGDKQATLERFAQNFQRLSASCKQRLTVENDDMPNAFSITDLLSLHEKTGIPLVFDFHHHRFCPGKTPRFLCHTQWRRDMLVDWCLKVPDLRVRCQSQVA